jgi:hypothetical protein
MSEVPTSVRDTNTVTTEASVIEMLRTRLALVSRAR